MGVAKVEYYGRTLIDLTGDSVNPDVLAEGETAHDANGDLIVGRGVLNKGNFANVIVGNVSGEIVAMDDVSPLEHKVSVKMRSKNLIPYPFTRSTATISGVTFTDNGDGTITVNGTATANAVYYFSYHMANPIDLPKGVYTLSGAPDGSAGNTYHLGIRKGNSGASEEFAVYASGRSMEMDLLEVVYIVVIKGVTANNLLFKPQLEFGATKTAYTPYLADNTEVTVTSHGANMLDLSKFTFGNAIYDAKNDEVTSNINNHYFCYCESTNPEVLSVFYGNMGKSFTLSIKGTVVDTALSLLIEGSRRDGSTYYEVVGQGKRSVTFTVPSDFINMEKVTIRFNRRGTPFSDTTSKFSEFMLSRIDNAEYEPYSKVEAITTLAKGVEFTSIAPNMTIYTDNEGVTVECSYNKDTNKVIEKLTQAIIALGGNV